MSQQKCLFAGLPSSQDVKTHTNIDLSSSSATDSIADPIVEGDFYVVGRRVCYLLSYCGWPAAPEDILPLARATPLPQRSSSRKVRGY